ncbi:hypothetical protein ACKKBF_B05755 [Auxenochlorella protothecoides x Auxenochlorella symbiontica]
MAMVARQSRGGGKPPLPPPATAARQRDDTLLFETPEELRCPITHDTFVNPVLTAGGHVYERSAIERHLAHRSTDPLTGAELPNKSLTPIYILQSRAMEYREASARACIEAASEPPPREPGAHRPIEHLRRGVELAAGTKLAIPGLPTETLEYVAAHPGNAYDELALVAFARGLFLSGLRDRAAHVYFSLLQEALCSKSDVPQAAALLAQCIGCWAGEPGKGVHVDADRHVIEKLSGLVATSGQGSGQQAALTWTQVVDLAGTAGLGDTFALSLCEHLLFRRGPGMAPPVGHQPSPAQEQWSLEKNLLLKYTSILCGGVTRSQAALERRLQRLEDGVRAREGSPGGRAEVAAPAGASPLAQQVDRCLHTPWLRAAAAAAVVVLPQGDAWLARGARSACIVLLVTSPQPRLSKSLGTRCHDDT